MADITRSACTDSPVFLFLSVLKFGIREKTECCVRAIDSIALDRSSGIGEIAPKLNADYAKKALGMRKIVECQILSR